VQGPNGVERVLILGAKAAYVAPTAPPAPAPPAEAATPPGEAPPANAVVAGDIVLESQRKGTSHALTLALEGNNGQRVQRALLLDTGADFVVLPSSLIEQLGMQPGGLRSQRVQTANGAVDARIGTLAAVWVGDKRLPGIQTAFIDDAKLGSSGLLGMSVLGRFRVTIDDARNQVVLSGR
jgi:aspartyl protease family protein